MNQTSINKKFPQLSEVRNFKRKMENKELLFIPDISGFTRFVNDSEINHSRLIIQELLDNGKMLILAMKR
jgi:hypothetical protein